MDETACETLIDALKQARKGKVEYHWEWVAEAEDGEPFLVVGRKPEPLARQARDVRRSARNARRAAGRVELGDEKNLVFVIAEGSALAKDTQKAMRTILAKKRTLAPARPWLTAAEVQEGAQDGAGVGGGLDIDTRSDVEDVSKASKRAEKKLSDYVGFLEALERWHARFDRGVAPEDLGRARAALDEIEAAARTWHASHKKKLLESGKNKKRRAEIDRVLGQVAEARSKLLRVGEGPSEDDLAKFREAEKEWMDERIEAEGDRVARWSEIAKDGLENGQYRQMGEPLAVGSYGRVVLLEAGDGNPELVVKFQTAQGRRAKPTDLHDEAGWYAKAGPHPNLARCLGVQSIDGEEALVLESLPGGDLSDFVTDGRRWVEEGLLTPKEYAAALQHCLRGMIRALSHLHGKGVHHNDVKPQNLMLDPRTGEAKLIDLGTAHDSSYPMHATPAYRDGQLHGDDPTGVDGSSVGMSAYEGVAGDIPSFRPERVEVPIEDAIRAVPGLGAEWDDWTEEERASWRDQISDQEIEMVERQLVRLQKQRARGAFVERGDQMFEQTDPDHPETTSTVPYVGAMHDFVNRLLASDTSERPSLEEMLELPFLSDSLLDEEEAGEILKRIPDLREASPRPGRG